MPKATQSVLETPAPKFSPEDLGFEASEQSESRPYGQIINKESCFGLFFDNDQAAKMALTSANIDAVPYTLTLESGKKVPGLHIPSPQLLIIRISGELWDLTTKSGDKYVLPVGNSNPMNGPIDPLPEHKDPKPKTIKKLLCALVDRDLRPILPPFTLKVGGGLKMSLERFLYGSGEKAKGLTLLDNSPRASVDIPGFDYRSVHFGNGASLGAHKVACETMATLLGQAKFWPKNPDLFWASIIHRPILGQGPVGTEYIKRGVYFDGFLAPSAGTGLFLPKEHRIDIAEILEQTQGWTQLCKSIPRKGPSASRGAIDYSNLSQWGWSAEDEVDAVVPLADDDEPLF